MRRVALATLITFATIGCGAIHTQPSMPSTSQPPNPIKLVGTPACPQLNAHDGKACRFGRAGHGFQVWPERIWVVADPQPGIWLVTSGFDDDLVFDHTMSGVLDDHVAFKCYIRPGDGSYWFPFDFTIKSGGVWATYGIGVKAIWAGALGIGLGPIGSASGGAGAEAFGKWIQSNEDQSWQKQAIGVANDICRYLAAPAVSPPRPGSLTIIER